MKRGKNNKLLSLIYIKVFPTRLVLIQLIPKLDFKCLTHCYRCVVLEANFPIRKGDGDFLHRDRSAIDNFFLYFFFCSEKRGKRAECCYGNDQMKSVACKQYFVKFNLCFFLQFIDLILV